MIILIGIFIESVEHFGQYVHYNNMENLMLPSVSFAIM